MHAQCTRKVATGLCLVVSLLYLIEVASFLLLRWLVGPRLASPLASVWLTVLASQLCVCFSF